MRDYRVLLALRVTGGGLSSAEVASFLFLNPSDVTSCPKNLGARGYITRERRAGNRRVRKIDLIDDGGRRIVVESGKQSRLTYFLGFVATFCVK